MLLTVTEKTIEWLSQRRVLSSWAYGHSRFQPGDIIVGLDHVQIEPYTGFYNGNVICELGSFSYSGSEVGLDWKVGRYCSLSWGITSPGPRHPMDFVSTSNCTYDRLNSTVRAFVQDQDSAFDCFFEVTQKAGPVLNNDVWVGAGAVLMPGVTLGTGSVVAAHSVVVKDVLPYEIVGGNPAKHIRFRFPEEIRNALLETEWWKYRFTDFKGMSFDKPERFIRNFEIFKNDLNPWVPPKFNLSEIPT